MAVYAGQVQQSAHQLANDAARMQLKDAAYTHTDHVSGHLYVCDTVTENLHV